jgi:transposase
MKQDLENLSKEQLIELFLTQQKELVSNKKELNSKEKELNSKEKELVFSERKLASKEQQIVAKEKQIVSHEKIVSEKEEEVSRLKVLVAMLKRMKFGTQSERFVKQIIDPKQLHLSFEELAQKSEKDPDGDKPVKKLITYERTKKKHNGRNKLPEDLAVKEIVIEPNESIEGLTRIGEERTEILEYTPGDFFKIVIIRPKYAKEENSGILIADMPSRPIEKCLAGNYLLASILINKYVDHLPLYRQQQIFKRRGIQIASSTIDSWVSKLGFLLEPLYNAMIESVRHSSYIQADETPTRVLDKNKKGKSHRGYYWVYHSPLKRMVIFDYQKSRNKDAPRKILENYKGYLQSDGYAVYNHYVTDESVVHLACWAHARRYFEQSLDNDKVRSEYVLLEIQKLYAIERELKEATSEERKKQRLEKSLPIINELGKWLFRESNVVLPKSSIGKAINYTKNLWDSLQSYLYNGDLNIDNNLVENSIRPNALGRKNYLFAGSHEGAQRTAMFYSFFGTCKLNGVNPEKWLVKVLSQIADHKVNKLYELFPQNLDLEPTDNNF